MSAPLAKEQIALLLSNTLTDRTAPVQRAGMVRRLLGVVRYLVELPRRQAVITELSRLSDRDLADIGLSRADLGHVFTGRPLQRP
jgi:uncharacterized protein YjiS (DUF1127 family)